MRLMSEAYTGGCTCGAIRYEVTAEPAMMNLCQCRQCLGGLTNQIRGGGSLGRAFLQYCYGFLGILGK